MTGPDHTILVERAAIQLSGSGVLCAATHVHTVMRGLGIAPAQAALFFDEIVRRVAEIEAGDFTVVTLDAIRAGAPTGDAFPEHPWDTYQRDLLRFSLTYRSPQEAPRAAE